MTVFTTRLRPASTSSSMATTSPNPTSSSCCSTFVNSGRRDFRLRQCHSYQEIVDVAGQEEEAANLMVGLSGSGMLFESVSRGNESYALSDGPAQTDRDNGWGIYYKPNSNPVTFAFEVFDSSYCCLLGCAC
jgi:hypothetical protein